MLPYILALAAIRAEGPCDILDAAGNPCVAAHSTTRALYAKYNGPLYNVTRPNGNSKLIGVLSAGGFADKAAHDAFCSPVRFVPLLVPLLVHPLFSDFPDLQASCRKQESSLLPHHLHDARYPEILSI